MILNKSAVYYHEPSDEIWLFAEIAEINKVIHFLVFYNSEFTKKMVSPTALEVWVKELIVVKLGTL